MESLIRRPQGRRESAAFTLVELLVAVALMTIFLTMVATVFTQSQGAFSSARAGVAMAQEARAVFDIMQRDLQAATRVLYYAPSSATPLAGYCLADDGAFVGNDPPGPVNPTTPPSPNQMPRLYFVSNSQQVAEASTVGDEPEPFFVAYKMAWSRKNKNRVRADGTEDPTPANRLRGIFHLERRVLKVHDEAYAGAGSYGYTNLNLENLQVDNAPTTTLEVVAAPIAFNILWIEYRFFDRSTNSWSTDGDWPTAATTTADLPLAVQVTLTLADPQRRHEAAYTTQFYIPGAANP